MKPSKTLRLLTVSLLATAGWLGAQTEKAPKGPIPICLEVPPPGGGMRGVGNRNLIWPKHELGVQFLDATSWQIRQVKRYAVDWEPHAGVTFKWDVKTYPDIRLSFKQAGGSWSYIGTEAEDVVRGTTMNLALTPETPEYYVKATIRHEFGHALGLMHEHQNWKKQFTWNEKAVLARYADAGWSDKRTIQNVLESLKDPNGSLYASAFDPKSIMLYPISAELTNEGFSSDWNVEMSELDKKTIRELYQRK